MVASRILARPPRPYQKEESLPGWFRNGLLQYGWRSTCCNRLAQSPETPDYVGEGGSRSEDNSHQGDYDQMQEQGNPS